MMYNSASRFPRIKWSFAIQCMVVAACIVSLPARADVGLRLDAHGVISAPTTLTVRAVVTQTGDFRDLAAAMVYIAFDPAKVAISEPVPSIGWVQDLAAHPEPGIFVGAFTFASFANGSSSSTDSGPIFTFTATPTAGPVDTSDCSVVKLKGGGSIEEPDSSTNLSDGEFNSIWIQDVCPGGEDTIAEIIHFGFSPENIPDSSGMVTATIETGGELSAIKIMGAASDFNGAPPAFSLTRDGNTWTATFPATFIKMARANPVAFTATATRADGTTTTATASVAVGQDHASLSVMLNPANGTARRNQVVSMNAVVTSPIQSPLALVSLTVDLPDGVTLESAPLFDKNPTARKIYWTGQLRRTPFGAGMVSLPFTVRVNADAPINSPLGFIATASLPPSDVKTASTSLTVVTGLLPRSVTVDASAGGGLMFGDATFNDGTQPLQATISPRPEVMGLLPWEWNHPRRFKIWLQTAESNSSGANVSAGGGTTAAILANLGLMAPSVSPMYQVTYSSTDDWVALSVGAGPKSLAVDMLEALLSLCGSPFSVNDVAAVTDDFMNISVVGKMISEFEPFPRNLGEALSALGRMGEDVIHIDAKDAEAITKVVNKALGTTFTVPKVLRLLNRVAFVGDMVQKADDYTVLAFGTRLRPMVVRFNASPLVSTDQQNGAVK